MKSLQENRVWDVVDLPEGKRVIGSKWIFKRKIGSSGAVERYKAQLVAQAYSQKYGLDYDETFSPLIRFESIRVLLALSARYVLEVHQMDVNTAFLNGELEEEVFMKQPSGFVSKGEEEKVCRLQRSIYGLRQSPRCWNFILDRRLKEMGFIQSDSDPCLYVDSNQRLFFVAVYVDDILLAGSDLSQMNAVKKALGNQFKVKDMGELHYFLGVTVVQNKSNNSIWIGQPLYTDGILRKYGMESAKPVQTPVNVSQKLTVQLIKNRQSLPSVSTNQSLGAYCI